MLIASLISLLEEDDLHEMTRMAAAVQISRAAEFTHVDNYT
jgi:hypothetical protein